MAEEAEGEKGQRGFLILPPLPSPASSEFSIFILNL
jgi:hypothetical protein